MFINRASLVLFGLLVVFLVSSCGLFTSSSSRSRYSFNYQDGSAQEGVPWWKESSTRGPSARKPFLKKSSQQGADGKKRPKTRMVDFIEKGAFPITRKDFPEVYENPGEKSWGALFAAFGNASGVGYRMLGRSSDPDRLFFMKVYNKDLDSKRIIREVLLYYAMKKGDLGKAEKIIKEGVSLNSTVNYKQTLLHVVFNDKHKMLEKMKLARMLIKAGADPKVLSKKGITVLKTVVASAIKKKKEAIALLVAHGANPDRVDKSGNLLLHEALAFAAMDKSGGGEKNVLSWLGQIITKKTDLNARNAEGKTPLGIVFLGQKNKLKKFLLKKGAKDYGFRNKSWNASKANGTTILGLSSREVYNLNKNQCQFILREYGVKFTPLSKTKAVALPIRLKSPIGGVNYRHVRDNKKFSIMDCRLAVALAGWGPILKKNKVKEIEHMRVYSPGAKVGGGKKISGHHYALALDVGRVFYKGGQVLSLKEDWKDHRKINPCEKPKSGKTKAEKKLRKLTCETGALDLFTIVLTPHYNKAHWDHLHVELDKDQYMFVR